MLRQLTVLPKGDVGMTDASMSGAHPVTAQPGNRYLNRTLLVLIIIAMVGFTMFSALQGFDFAAYPLATHVHAISMASWLILLAVQTMLGSSGNIALHKRLGWLGMALAIFIVGSGITVSFTTLMVGRLPPFFEAGYFFTLGLSNMVLFTLFVLGGVLTRSNTAWHRRFMLGTLLVVFEPVLGRILPFFVVPAIGGPDNLLPFLEQNRMPFEVFRASVHLAIIALVMIGDRMVTGRFHPVFGLMLICVTAFYGVVNFVGGSEFVETFANGLLPAG